ncbi:MAG: RES protein [uncultured bacterium]|nr:MAG: RES protein [uncultured bacterium]
MQEYSWKAPDKFVCPDCVGDDFLKEKIVQNLTAKTCGYCGKSGEEDIAAPVSAIMESIAQGLSCRFVDWHDADFPDECDWDEEFAKLPTTEEALRKIPLEGRGDLLRDVAVAFRCNRWKEKTGGFHDYDMSMRGSWDYLVWTVKHHERFFFSSTTTMFRFAFQKTPAELLGEIGQIVSELELVKPLLAETELFRVRVLSKKEDWCLADIEKNLGAPPNDKVLSSQRMNPAGISYFYLAKERATAMAEALSKPPCQAALGCFKIRRDIRVLDLMNLPKIPSPFDGERHHEGETIAFLTEFADEISKPVQKDGSEHIEYVPSQVVCEYFAKVFRTEDGKPIDGLAYPSAIRPGGTNIVLFPPQRGTDFSDMAGLVKAEEIEFPNWFDFQAVIRAV